MTRTIVAQHVLSDHDDTLASDGVFGFTVPFGFVANRLRSEFLWSVVGPPKPVFLAAPSVFVHSFSLRPLSYLDSKARCRRALHLSFISHLSRALMSIYASSFTCSMQRRIERKTLPRVETKVGHETVEMETDRDVLG